MANYNRLTVTPQIEAIVRDAYRRYESGDKDAIANAAKEIGARWKPHNVVNLAGKMGLSKRREKFTNERARQHSSGGIKNGN